MTTTTDPFCAWRKNPIHAALDAAQRLAEDADRDAALDQLDRLADLAPGAATFAVALRAHLGALATGEV